MIYLYTITDQPEALLPILTNLEVVCGHEASIYSLVYRDIAAVASLLTTAVVPATEANLWRHEAVIEEFMADHAVLPMRFGTVFNDEAALQAVLITHYADFVDGLKRIRGLVELSLRVLWERQGGSEVEEQSNDSGMLESKEDREEGSRGKGGMEGSGRAYMLARLKMEQRDHDRRQQAETLAAELHLPLARLSVESTYQILLTSHLVLKAAYLVAREQVPAFQQQIEGHSQDYPSLRFLCTGPWPPYNFVNAIHLQAPELSNV